MRGCFAGEAEKATRYTAKPSIDYLPAWTPAGNASEGTSEG